MTVLIGLAFALGFLSGHWGPKLGSSCTLSVTLSAQGSSAIELALVCVSVSTGFHVLVVYVIEVCIVTINLSVLEAWRG